MARKRTRQASLQLKMILFRIRRALGFCQIFLLCCYVAKVTPHDDDGGDGFEDLAEEGASGKFNDMQFGNED